MRGPEFCPLTWRDAEPHPWALGRPSFVLYPGARATPREGSRSPKGTQFRFASLMSPGRLITSC